MSPEIPNVGTARKITSFARTTNYECAAACLSDEDANHPYPDRNKFIRYLRVNRAKPYFEFRFGCTQRQQLIFGAFEKPESFVVAHPDHPITAMIQCAEIRRDLRHRLDNPSGIPDFDESFQGFWTRNLKVAAAMLYAKKVAVSDAVIRRHPGKYYIFLFDEAPMMEIVDAFRDPRAFNAANREHWLSYVTYFFHARERLLDAMNDPNRVCVHVVRQPSDEGDTIVTTPERNPKRNGDTKHGR